MCIFAITILLFNQGVIAMKYNFKTKAYEKIFYSVLFLLAGLLAGNNVNAQEVADIYSVDFSVKEWHGWTLEGGYADKELWTVKDGALIAYGHMVTSSCESKVVSPMIKLGDKNNTVTFSYQGWYLGDITKEVGLAVREQDGEWINTYCLSQA